MQSLRARQIAAGASLSDENIPLSFHNDTAVKLALQNGAALYDCSHWGRIQLTGEDRLRFLHNQTTNNFTILQPGQGCDTVFVTPTARTIDLVTAYLLPDFVLLLTSPGYSQRLIEWMDRFIFFSDRVELQDVTASTAAFSLLGANCDAILNLLGASAILGQPAASHQLFHFSNRTFGSFEVRVAVGSGLQMPGYRLFVQAEQAEALWKILVDAGAMPMGETFWQTLRVEQGRPLPEQELTDDYNPLEAGLWHTISLSKGCYIGQETIARLHTYKGVKQQLWGISFPAGSQIAPGDGVTSGEDKIGRITSVTQTEAGPFALAYIRTKAIESAQTVQVGTAEGALVALPFVSHEYL
ncbi:MAG: YgfZ/GcvT domain-containing protein [Elainella sp.]